MNKTESVNNSCNNKTPESGNILFFILIAIVLIGLVTAAIRSGDKENANIDKESLIIRASSVREYATSLERAVAFILQDGQSESDISFAHPNAPSDYGSLNTNPRNEVFNPDGGGADYQSAPSGINNGDQWEFYGNTHLPEVGTPTRAELIAVLPNVTEQFCDHINASIGYDIATQPVDSGTCLKSADGLRFSSAQQFVSGGSINTVEEATFTKKPSNQGCVECGSSSGNFHYFHVLLAR